MDDALVFSRMGDPACQKVYDAYRDLAPKMGVKLAPEEDADKAFPPSTKGICLGVELDLLEWTWKVPHKKVVVLRHDLHMVASQKEVRNGMVEELSGRLNHYAVLVEGGMWERSFITQLHDAQASKTKMVVVSLQARQQAAWWLAALPAAEVESRIRDLSVGSREGFELNLYPDAAGGSDGHVQNGAGGVIWETGHWYTMVWPRWIQEGRASSLGVTMNSKLTTLEGLAALFLLVAEPRLVRMRSVCIWTDNQGLYYAFAKKGSRCPYAYTVAKALQAVATGLDILLEVRKAPRCSSAAEECADALSKGDINRFRKHCSHRRSGSSPASKVLKRWLADPHPTMDLGRHLLVEVESQGTEVLWFDEKPKHKL